MIKLDKYDKQLILLCKGHLTDKYPLTGKWENTIKPWYFEVYGVNPDENYQQYLQVIFYKLLDVHLKIKEDFSGNFQQIKDVFSSTFQKRLSNDSELPIERAIHTLCGLIACTKVTDDEGNKRFDLDKL